MEKKTLTPREIIEGSFDISAEGSIIILTPFNDEDTNVYDNANALILDLSKLTDEMIRTIIVTRKKSDRYIQMQAQEFDKSIEQFTEDMKVNFVIYTNNPILKRRGLVAWSDGTPIVYADKEEAENEMDSAYDVILTEYEYVTKYMDLEEPPLLKL